MSSAGCCGRPRQIGRVVLSQAPACLRCHVPTGSTVPSARCGPAALRTGFGTRLSSRRACPQAAGRARSPGQSGRGQGRTRARRSGHDRVVPSHPRGNGAGLVEGLLGEERRQALAAEPGFGAVVVMLRQVPRPGQGLQAPEHQTASASQRSSGKVENRITHLARSKVSGFAALPAILRIRCGPGTTGPPRDRTVIRPGQRGPGCRCLSGP